MNKASYSQLIYSIADSLYINISNRCTLECQFCPKTHGDRHVHAYDLTLDKQPSSVEIIKELAKPETKLEDYKEVVFCGFGEPTLRLKVLKEVASHLKKQGKKVRLNTDGLGNLVHKRNILPELSTYIDAVSISLNSDNEASYIQHCAPKLDNSYQSVLEFIRLAPRYIQNVRVTAIDGLEQVDIDKCRLIAQQNDVDFLMRKLDVIG